MKDSKPFEGLAVALRKLADTMVARANGMGRDWMYREIKINYV